MKRPWLWLTAGIVLTVLFAAGCSKRKDVPVHTEENPQTLCGKVESVSGDMIVLEIGTVNDFGETSETDEEGDCFGGILAFIPSGERTTIKLAKDAVISTMNGVKKTEAAVADVETGDILAVTLSQNLAVTVVIHQAAMPGETS